MGTLLKFINPVYFWDTDTNILEEYHSKKLIIERVFALGTLKEIQLVMDFYGREEVIQILKSLSYIDPKTLNFISIKFNIQKSAFRCYKKMRLTKRFWD
jgi:hypothetical protein